MIYDNKDKTTIEKFLKESAWNKNKIAITIDLDKKIFYKNLISDEEYHGCYQQLKIIRYLFDLNNCNEFTNKL